MTSRDQTALEEALVDKKIARVEIDPEGTELWENQAILTMEDGTIVSFRVSNIVAGHWIDILVNGLQVTST